MTSAQNPESGTVSYVYDSESSVCNLSFAGDLVKRTDARGVSTCYSYDRLHRLLSKTYTDSTPAVTIAYDNPNAWGLNLSNTIGQRVTIQTADGTGTAFSYDVMGRETQEAQCVPWGLNGCSTFMSTRWANRRPHRCER